MTALVFFIGCAVLAAGYVFYGRWVAGWLGVDDSRKTPAHLLNDGVDYVPAHTPMLFGHHFSSIAGAGPIVGPIVAALWFGWLPALLWILVGAVLVGGVHDFSALIASIRHRGRSIGELCRSYLSPFTYRVFLAFIWFTLIYVLIVFLDLTAGTFAPGVLEDAEAVRIGGATATASLLYIGIALVFGFTVAKGLLSFKTGSLIFVPLVFAALFVGIQAPFEATRLPAFIYGHPKYTWTLALLAYCFAASITPVWALLQPRDYLSSFLLYACLIGGSAGLLIAGISGQAPANYPRFLGLWRDADTHTGFIFPLLFITVACGAVSGFHSIVASGTSAKQLGRESAAKPVAYGGMLVEGILALVAVAGIMLVTQGDPVLKQHPTKLFAVGIGNFFNAFGVPQSAGVVFGLLAVSTFLLTTLDTGTRLSRFVFEEFFGLNNPRWRYLSTFVTLILPAVIVFMRFRGPGGNIIPAWQKIWPVFGATNQLLAAMALLVVFVWLAYRKRRKAFVFIPMVFMFVTTVTMLIMLIRDNLFAAGGQWLIGTICLLLLVLALCVVVDTVWHWSRIRAGEPTETA